MRNIKLILEYDGTNYAGWQRQDNVNTIQQELEKAIYKLTKENIRMIASSRTDAGVHAKGFVCNFTTETNIPGDRFKKALNTKLPGDIVVINSQEVPVNFHSRYHCKGKTYSYSVLNNERPIAIGKDYFYQYKKELNLDDMIKGAEFLVGTHDFAAFKNIGGSVKTSVRTITKLEITRNKDLIVFTISANGFLYNMVRIIVGTLIDVGRKKIEPQHIITILQSKDRKQAAKTAPANGLCLEEVYY